MNVKNIVLMTLAISAGFLFFVLQKHSKNYYSSLEQSQAPVIEIAQSRYYAPDFTLTDLDKNEFKLSDSRGNVVAMMFWTTW